MPAAFDGLPVTVVEVGDLVLEAVVAETPGSRSRGLMGIADLGPVDGMVFAFEGPSQSGFFMKDVLIPLDIAFVGDDGTVLDVQTMALCPAEPCPTYHSPAPFTLALETPAGGLAEVDAGDRFSVRPWR